MHRNAIPGPENFSLEHSGCKIIGFHSRNVRSWAQQVSNLRYSNPTVNKSFKNSHFYYHKFAAECFFYQTLKKIAKKHENHA